MGMHHCEPADELSAKQVFLGGSIRIRSENHVFADGLHLKQEQSPAAGRLP